MKPLYIKLLLFPFVLFFLGCSSKTEYPQLEGKTIKYYQVQHQNINLNKKLLLQKVDLTANQVFSNLEKNEKKINNFYYNQILKNIYNNSSN